MFTREQVARVIDHAVLKTTMTDADIVANAKMCRERGVGNMCVRPTDVALAMRELKGSQTTVGAVIGFPHGSNRSDVKVHEARLAMEDGAQELDMVMNIGKFLSGDFAFVEKDIHAVVVAAASHGALVKVILETSYLSANQIAQACRLAEAAGADFVKTSTGFAEGGGGATLEAVDVMLKTVGESMGVKASGGIRSWETAVAFLKQGCKRLGVGSTEKVLDGAKSDAAY